MKVVKLGEVLGILSGYAFNSKLFNKSGEGLPLIRIRDLKKVHHTESFFSGEYDDKFLVNSGDYLIGMDGEFKCHIWKGSQALLNQRVCKLIDFDHQLHPQFLFYGINQFLKDIEDKTSFSTVKHLSIKDIKEIDFPLPPLETQRRIAAVLEKADHLRSLRRQALARLDDLVQSVFLEMFGDPVTNPMGWEISKLENEIEFLTSGSRGWAKYYSEQGAKFIRIQNVKNGLLNFDDVQHVEAPNTQESKRTKVKEGDLLISITADLGRTAVVNSETALNGAHINQHLALIRLKSSLKPRFVSALLEGTFGKRQFQSLDLSAVKSGLNFDSIKSINVIKPPIEEQLKFEKVFNQYIEKKNDLQNQSQKLDNLFNSLMQKAFKGELQFAEAEQSFKQLELSF